MLQRIHPDDLVMMRRALDQTSRGEKDFDITHRLLTPDGSVKFVHVLSHVLKDGAGNLEIVGALMDVTENTRLYRDLAEREAKDSALRRGQHNRHLCIGISKAGSSRPTSAFLRMVGYEREDLVSGRMRWPSLTPAGLHSNDERTLAQLKATGTVAAVRERVSPERRQPCARSYGKHAV